MSDQKTPMRAPWGDIAPRLTEISDTILFDDVWQRPGLSPRDRSLITVAALVALYRENEMPFHLKKALENGVTREEIIEAVTHLAFYRAGRPPARHSPSYGACSTTPRPEHHHDILKGTNDAES